MNKLLVSDIIDLDNGEYELDIKSKELIINVKGYVKIYLVDNNLNKLDINLNDDSNVYLYDFNKKTNNMIININQNNSSCIYYNSSFINDSLSEVIINSFIKGNNNNNNISVRNISNKDLSKIIINTYISKNTNNNIALEDLKGINNGGMVHIEPNIICDSNEVVANHLTTIGSIDKENLNYLMSKGISLDNSKKILLRGFKYSNMDEYIKNMEVI